MRCSKCNRRSVSKGLCRPCYDREKYGTATLPAAPLHSLIQRTADKIAAETESEKAVRVTTNSVARLLGMNGRTFARLMQSTDVRIQTADRICCRLGVHPMEIWGNEWLAA